MEGGLGQSAAVASFRARLLARIRRHVSVDAAFFATCDPETLLFTSAWADDVLAPSAPLFLDNEFGTDDDVNRFASLASSRRGVATLDEATRGDRTASARFCNVLRPLGLGDELRVALRSGDATWGFLCLHRAPGAGFSGRDTRAVESLARRAGEEMREIVVDTAARMLRTSPAPAVVLADGERVLAATSTAENFLQQRLEPGSLLPFPLLVAVRRLAARARAHEGDAVVITTLRRDGTLVAIHASHLNANAGSSRVALALAPASAAARSSLLLAAHGLTPAQRRVAALVLRGKSTRQIVRELRIGAHTVQDHLKAVFAKVGVASRRDLVAALMR
jgi:DNA-binding CsgD family transcriptional regulator